MADDRHLKRLCQQNCHASASHLKVKQENISSANISARTVHMQLTKCDFLAYCPKKKPLLIQKMEKKKLA